MKFEKIIKKTKSLSASVSASKIESLRSNTDTQTTIRAYDNGFLGISGCVGKADEKKLNEQAIEKLNQQIPYPCELEKNVLHVDATKKIIDPDQYIAVLRKLLDRLSREFEGFNFSNKINLDELDASYQNSEGADMSYKCNRLSVSLVVQDCSQSNIMDLGIGGNENFYDEDKIVEDARMQIEAFKNRVELPSLDLPVVVNGSAFFYILKDFIAEYYASGASLFNGKLNQKIFSDKVNLAIHRNPDDGIPPFDAEGVILPDYKHYLVKDGVLNGLLTTKRSAKMYGYAVGGCAGSQGFDSIPVIGAAGLDFMPTCENLSDITDTAIYVAISSGGDVSPSGDFGLPVQLSYLYQNGKLVGKLPELMLSGNVFDLLNDGYLGTTKKSIFSFDGTPHTVVKFKVEVKG